MKKIVLALALVFTAALVSATDLGSLSVPAKGAKSLGASQAVKGADWKVGQWVVYKQLEDKQLKSVMKMALIAHDGDVWTMEIDSYSDRGDQAMQMKIKGLEKLAAGGSNDQVEIVGLKVKEKNGQVQELPAEMMGMFGGMYKKAIPDMKVSSSGFEDGGALTVPAGTFAKTWKITSESEYNGKKFKGTAWVHSAVPINKTVKSVAEDGKYVTELVDFGDSGFVSAF